MEGNDNMSFVFFFADLLIWVFVDSLVFLFLVSYIICYILEAIQVLLWNAPIRSLMTHL